MKNIFFIIPVFLILNYVSANEKIQLDIKFEYDRKYLTVNVEIKNNTNTNIYVPITNTVINNIYPYYKRLDKVFSYNPFSVNNIFIHPKNYKIKKLDPFYNALERFPNFKLIESYSNKIITLSIPIGKDTFNFKAGEISGIVHYLTEDTYKKLIKSFKGKKINYNLNTIIFDTMYQQPIISNDFIKEKYQLMMDNKASEIYSKNRKTIYFNIDMDSIEIVNF